MPSSNNVDLNEPAAKKQKIKAHSEFQSWWDDNFESWWDDHCLPSFNEVDLNEPVAKKQKIEETVEHEFRFAPGSAIGVVVDDKDGRCVVVGKRIAQTPLEIDDIIVSVNGINLTRDRRVSDQNVLKTLVSIIKNSSNVEKSIVVVRQHQTSSQSPKDT